MPEEPKELQTLRIIWLESGNGFHRSMGSKEYYWFLKSFNKQHDICSNLGPHLMNQKQTARNEQIRGTALEENIADRKKNRLVVLVWRLSSSFWNLSCGNRYRALMQTVDVIVVIAIARHLKTLSRRAVPSDLYFFGNTCCQPLGGPLLCINGSWRSHFHLKAV